jgi:HEPN domain-containing protein
MICFASQQSAEKYLKAFLVGNNVRFSKTHILVRELLPLGEGKDSEFKYLAPHLAVIDPYVGAFRYPGDEPMLEEARALLKLLPRFDDLFASN